MGSLVYSEVVHDTPHHPYTSSMLDTSSHRARRLSNDLSFRPVSQRSTSQHQQRPSSSTPRSSNVRGTPASSSSTPSQQRPRNASSPSQEMTSDSKEERPASSQSSPPQEPGLGPTEKLEPAEVERMSGQQNPDASNDGSADQGAQAASMPTPPNRVKVKDLQHIASCVNDETGGLSLSRSAGGLPDGVDDPDDMQYEISSMPISDVIEMVAGLLTKITSTNDRQHEHLHRQIPPLDGGGPLASQTSSVLSFHGKNVPSITIMSYLSRIHKYCPTTYDVFLSLLVYFDRMTERVNAGPLQSLKRSREALAEKPKTIGESRASSKGNSGAGSVASPKPQSSGTNTPPSSTHATPEQRSTEGRSGPSSELPSPPLSDSDPYSLTSFFVVDSFNIHRLIIAGVTCASKFFSDIFYTNSRYAKVGGLPLAELNHLEIQFLILNDFRLSVPAEELEAYGTMLVKFYAREVFANKQHESMEDVTSP